MKDIINSISEFLSMEGFSFTLALLTGIIAKIIFEYIIGKRNLRNITKIINENSVEIEINQDGQEVTIITSKEEMSKREMIKLINTKIKELNEITGSTSSVEIIIKDGGNKKNAT